MRSPAFRVKSGARSRTSSANNQGGCRRKKNNGPDPEAKPLAPKPFHVELHLGITQVRQICDVGLAHLAVRGEEGRQKCEREDNPHP